MPGIYIMFMLLLQDSIDIIDSSMLLYLDKH